MKNLIERNVIIIFISDLSQQDFFPVKSISRNFVSLLPAKNILFSRKKITFQVFSAMGAAYGTAKSGTGIAAMSVMRPELIMKSIIPVVMAGIIAIYGVVVAVLIAGQMKSATDGYTLYK